MTNRLTSTSFAVLGLLATRRWTTYELAKQVQRSLGWFWPRAERKLYDEPKRLVEAGLATATEERTGRRPRTVYAITPKGRRELRGWLGEPSAAPALEFEGMIRVFFADAGSLDQLRATLREVEQQARDRLVELREMVASDSAEGADEFSERRHVSALGMRFHLEHQQLLVDWARWALEQISSWPATDDPGAWDWRRALDASMASPTDGVVRPE